MLIVDYKSGSGKNRPLAKVDREQLLIYQWAALVFLRERVFDLQYWYLRDKLDIKSFLGTNDQIEEVKEGLQETADRITESVLNNDFEKYHKKHQGCEFELR